MATPPQSALDGESSSRRALRPIECVLASYRKNADSLWTHAAYVTNAGLQFMVVVVLARFTTVETVGNYAYCSALLTPVFTFLNLRLRTVQAADIANDYTFAEYAAVRALTIALGIGFVPVLNWTVARDAPLLLLGAFALMRSGESIGDCHHGVLQRHGHLSAIGRSISLRSTAGLIALVFALFATSSVECALLAVALAAFGTTVLFDARQLQRVPTADRSTQLSLFSIVALFWKLLPLGFGLLGATLTASVPRIVLAKVAGPASAALYSIPAQFITIGTVFISALVATRSHVFSRAVYFKDRKATKRLAWRTASACGALGTIAFALFALAGEQVLVYLFGEQYRQSWAIGLIIFAGSPFTFLSIATGMLTAAARITSGQVLVAISSLVTVSITALVLVGVHGAIGGAVALVAGYLVQALGQAILLWRGISR